VKTEGQRDLERRFHAFDAAKANCHLSKDRHHLLAIIESGVGSLDAFNRKIRDLIHEQKENTMMTKGVQCV
jgi:hypothetical protein